MNFINKTILLIAIIFQYNSIYSQSKYFELKGEIEGVTKGFIELQFNPNYASINVKSLKSRIENGLFNFSGEITHPGMIILQIDSNENLQTNWFFVDTGIQNVKIKIFGAEITTKSDSYTFNEYNNLKLIFDSINNSEVKNISFSDNTFDINSNFNNKFASQRDSLLLIYLKKNNHSYVGLINLSTFLYQDGYKDIYDTIFNIMDKVLQESPLGKLISKKLYKINNFKIGQIFPPIQLRDTNKNLVNLSEKFIKPYTLVDFWFHNCGACIEQFPKLKSIYIKYYKKGFEIIGISVDLEQSEPNWKRAIIKHKLIWPQYWDQNQKEALMLNIHFFPTNYLLDKNGIIISKNISLIELEKLLKLNLLN